MHLWYQTYLPLGSLCLSALAADIPIVFFFVALTSLRLNKTVSLSCAVLSLVRIQAFAKMKLRLGMSPANFPTGAI